MDPLSAAEPRAYAPRMGAPEPTRLRLAAVRVEQVPALLEWLERDRGPAPIPHSAAEYERSAQQGLLFAITEASAFRAVSGVFELSGGRHFELGGTYVVPALRGFGLQRLVIQVRLAAVTRVLPPKVEVLTAIRRSNEHSIQNAKAAGFVPWPDPVPCVYAVCSACDRRTPEPPPAGCCCEVLIAPREAMVAAAATLSASQRSVLLNSRELRTCVVELAIPAVR